LTVDPLNQSSHDAPVPAYRFGSPDWIATAHRVFNAAVAAAGPAAEGVDFTICEVYTGAPADLAPEGVIAWHCRVRDCRATVSFGDQPAADLHVTFDYETVLPIARTIVAGDAEADRAMQRQLGAAIRAGKATVRGDFALFPAFLSGVHDEIAALTA
jgi:hypothetical protein